MSVDIDLDGELEQVLAEALERAANRALDLVGPALRSYALTALPRVFGAAWPTVRRWLADRYGRSEAAVEHETAAAVVDRVLRRRAS